MIRGKTHACPFGLPILFGCKSVGGGTKDSSSSIISLMAPMDEDMSNDEKEEITENNLEMLLMIDEEKKCPFADMILEDNDSVDCKYDSKFGAMPAGNVGFSGSPLYPHIHVGNMSEAQYGYPLEYYSDNNESRNVYYGIYSLVG